MSATSSPLTPAKIADFGKRLDDAMREGREIDRLTTEHPALSLDDAYAIQDEGIGLRKARGEHVIGLKMGLTSRAKREQMNLHSAIYGVLTDAMRVHGGRFSMRGKIHPKIEPELAFYVAEDVRGEISVGDAMRVCSGFSAAMEILDSRYVGFKYFSLPDVVADNSSSAYFVLGEPSPMPSSPEAFNAIELAMHVDGALAQSANASEISGNPIHSLVEQCKLLHARGLYLPAGSVVLAGAATQAAQLAAGMRVTLHATGLPGVTVDVVE